MVLIPLIVVALTIAIGREASADDPAIIKDPVEDLIWTRVLPKRGSTILQVNQHPISNQELDVGASASHDHVLPNRYSSGGFSNLLSMSSVPVGKRRLDADVTPLISVSQADFEALASSGRQIRQNSRRGNNNVHALYDAGLHNPNQSSRVQQNRLSIANQKNQNRKSMGDLRSANEMAHQRGQESRKNSARPLVKMSKRRSSSSSSKSKGDDGSDFDSDASYDEDRNLVANRRSSGIVDKGEDRNGDDDGEEDDDDDGDNDGDGAAKSRRPSNRQHSSGGRLSAAPSRQQPRRKKQRELAHESDLDDKELDGDDGGDSDTADTIAKQLGVYIISENQPLALPKVADEDEAASQQLVHSSAELQTAAGHHHGHHGHYYQHVEVPKKKTWKFGFKRGNHKHEIQRHEKGHKHKFHSEFKWHAKEKCKKKKKCKSVGKMTWEYKHAKKHHHP